MMILTQVAAYGKLTIEAAYFRAKATPPAPTIS